MGYPLKLLAGLAIILSHTMSQGAAKSPAASAEDHTLSESLAVASPKVGASKPLPEEVLSAMKAVDIPQALIASFPPPLMGTALSYLPIDEIVGIHATYPYEKRSAAYALYITPSPILWNFHKPLYSLGRFEEIFSKMAHSESLTFKLLNVGPGVLRAVAPHIRAAGCLDVSTNLLGVEGACVLALHLPPRITYLNAAVNDFGDEGLAVLSEALLRHSSIQEVSLLWNNHEHPEHFERNLKALRDKGVNVRFNPRMLR